MKCLFLDVEMVEFELSVCSHTERFVSDQIWKKP